MTNHILKCWSPSFTAIDDDSKPFDVRKDDRNYAVGDRIEFREWNPDTGYTGHSITRKVTCKLDFGGLSAVGLGGVLAPGYCILGLSRFPKP